jgi:hypothetical protein
MPGGRALVQSVADALRRLNAARDAANAGDEPTYTEINELERALRTAIRKAEELGASRAKRPPAKRVPRSLFIVERRDERGLATWQTVSMGEAAERVGLSPKTLRQYLSTMQGGPIGQWARAPWNVRRVPNGEGETGTEHASPPNGTEPEQNV